MREENEIKNIEWNFEGLLRGDKEESVEENKKEVQEAAAKFVKKWKNRKDYMENADSLKEALDDYERWARFFGTAGNAGFYFWLRREIEQNNPDVSAGYNKLDELSKKIANEMQFFSLNLGKIDVKLQKKFVNDPVLSNYKHFLEKIFAQAKYMLSDEQEKILNLMEANAYTKWVNLVSGNISKAEKEVLLDSGKKEKKTFEAILKLTWSSDKRVRDDAADKVNEILEENVDVAEVELNAVLSFKKTIAELRKFERPDKQRHVADDIDSEVVDVLIDSVTKKFEISKKFYELKSKLLGVDKLKYHERNVEYGGKNKEYSYLDSIKLIDKVFGQLDDNFSKYMNQFIKEGRIDVYPRKGKRGGAFCAHELITQSPYILLNHTDKLDDVCTFAHELGHGINYEFMKKRQNALNFGTCLATAEVASTFMEDFVLEEILNDADEETKLAIMIKRVADSVQTIIRQTALYNFERELHSEFAKKGYLSKDEIGKMFQKHMAAYMGPFVEQSPGSENWWVHWWHIRECFYVYSYASGLLISKALQKEVKKNRKVVEKVKEFLSSGLSDSPKNIFAKLGIDITQEKFWNEGLDEVESLLNETEKLAKKLGKI